MIVPLVAYLERPDSRCNRAVAQRQIARTVIEQLITAFLRFEGQGERGVPRYVDPLNGIHLNRDSDRQAKPLLVQTTFHPLQATAASLCIGDPAFVSVMQVS